ncbi:hypothetical protein LR48_Vigan665s000600 [Vigna angularis]|uniref:Uncharacterized protein n=1 Tax=Phaseolus angularis TaxID=3914 RepID=A0A0L9TG27_PHAAN|nr:uncharacterized protein HKW66_Vig0148250 [Vigna angularis]KOM29416.1 hypothetical protein LR48_Vigan665s000600 [Vigna angularis]
MNCPWTLQDVRVAGCNAATRASSSITTVLIAGCFFILMNTTSAAVFLYGAALSFAAGGCFNKVLDRLLQAAGRDSTISACGLLLPAPLLQACCTVLIGLLLHVGAVWSWMLSVKTAVGAGREPHSLLKHRTLIFSISAGPPCFSSWNVKENCWNVLMELLPVPTLLHLDRELLPIVVVASSFTCWTLVITLRALERYLRAAAVESLFVGCG